MKTWHTFPIEMSVSSTVMESIAYQCTAFVLVSDNHPFKSNKSNKRFNVFILFTFYCRFVGAQKNAVMCFYTLRQYLFSTAVLEYKTHTHIAKYLLYQN